LPSRNWLIFLSITGSFASAVIYDKYQTRRNREKWCNLVSHIPNEYLPTNMMPRKMTVYLAAPPGDSLRSAREHFHLYVKPVLVAAAMDWDVVEGRKEGDVRYKTAERIRKKRKRAGEGEPPTEEEADMITVDGMRKEKGIVEYDGVAGDLVIGRNTWKEYVRGLHEGWLGPGDPPKPSQADSPEEAEASSHSPGQSSLGDAAVKAAVNSVKPPSTKSAEEKKKKKKEEEEEKPKPRQPPPYIQPSEYQSATPSNHISEIIGPSIGIRYPHILGFRNTPIRIYRFLTRRNLADSVGRDVAAAVLASHRPYSTDAAGNDETLSSESEVAKVLQHEESDWWKTTFYPRKEHEESVWIEDMVLDERIVGRMRAFQLTAEDEDRAKRIQTGKEKVVKDDQES
jgi:import inner membrane translocase subunit TIM54